LNLGLCSEMVTTNHLSKMLWFLMKDTKQIWLHLKYHVFILLWLYCQCYLAGKIRCIWRIRCQGQM
jgi:hypothetical protein